MVKSIALSTLILVFIHCGGTAGSNRASSGQPAVPQSRVALVVLENTSYADVVGAAAMPYLNSLVSEYGLATDYFAVTHPSIGNYFMLTTGQVITNDDAYAGMVSEDNLARELAYGGKTWKVYAESIPSVGYLGGDVFPYIRSHVPFTYFSDVVSNAAQASNIVPFTQLAVDLQNRALPDFLFIVPNAIDDAHSCPPANPACTLADREAMADQWLRTNIAPLLQNAGFQSNGLLVIVFDEAEDTDSRNGGGQVACVLAGATVRPGFRSANLYQHENLLALIGSALRLGTIPGAGANANNMSEFFQ